MPEEKDESKNDLKSEIAQHKPRDEEGHFIHLEENKSENKPPANPIDKFIKDHTSYSKSQDDLLDVHVGNPLHKITELLEDIKKQKAFSFTLKGSLGIAGVFLTLSVFGILGGGKILCDRGVQTHVGTVKVLQVMDSDPDSGLPLLSDIIAWFQPKASHPRVVLLKPNGEAIKIPYSNQIDTAIYANYQIIATGNYDSCSQTLTPKSPNSLQPNP